MPYSRPKRLKSRTVWGRAFLYGLYQRVPPPGGERRTHSRTRTQIRRSPLMFSVQTVRLLDRQLLT